MLMPNILQRTGQPSVSPPTKTYLAQRIISAEVEEVYSQALLPGILSQRIGAKSTSCLSTVTVIRIIFQDVHLGWKKGEHTVVEAGMAPRPLLPVCHWY